MSKTVPPGFAVPGSVLSGAGGGGGGGASGWSGAGLGGGGSSKPTVDYESEVASSQTTAALLPRVNGIVSAVVSGGGVSTSSGSEGVGTTMGYFPGIPSVPSAAEIRAIRDELVTLLAANKARDRLVAANADAVSRWLASATLSSASSVSQQGHSVQTQQPALPLSNPSPDSVASPASAQPFLALKKPKHLSSTDSLSSDAQTPFAYSTAGIPKAMSPQGDSALVLPSNASSSLASSYSITSVTGGSGGSMAGKKRKPPTFNSSATAAAPDDVDVDRALLYRKTDDGSVKIAITQNGKMKVKIADSALAATSSSVPSAVAAMGSVSTPQSLSASSGATGTGIVPLNALASAAAVNKAFGTPPVAPIFSKVSSKLGGAGGVGAAGMGAGGAGSSGTPVASWPTGLAAGPAGGVPKQQKSKAAKNLSALEKNKSRNRKKGGGGGGASAAQQQDGEDTPLNEADLAILRGDYSNAKAPANQIPINQFFSFVDTQFFRSLCDEDFAFLDHTGDEVTPYVLPRLGRNYHEQWAEEDNNLAPLKAQQQPFWTPEFGYQQPPPPPPAGPREYEEADDTVYGGDVYIGPLAERILASLAEGGGGGGAVGTLLPGSGEEDTAAGAPAVVPGALSRVRTTADVLGFEERLRSELRHLGLFGDGEVETDPTEQDEICAELRMLQNELRQQVAENAKRKAVLKEIASFYRGYEQYNSVLDAISKQIESDYLKRYRQNPNKKKKSGGSRPSGGGSSSTAGGSAASLSPALGVGTAGFAARHNISDQTLDNIKKRRMLIDSIGSLFPYDRVTFPSESIYAGLGVAGEVGAETAGTPSAMDL